MSGNFSSFKFVEIPRPGRGHPVAHEAATLLLQGIQGVQTPTPQEVLRTVAIELDGNFSLAVVNPEGSVMGTGGLILVEAEGFLAGAVVNMVVAPDERGRGLGHKIMSKLEEGARKAGAREIFGQPHPGSQGFYEKFGSHLEQRSYMKGDILVKTL